MHAYVAVFMHFIYFAIPTQRVYLLCMYVYPNRSKIEKEFDENPLIKNLGITIYGSVHEARQREIAERKVCEDFFYITKVEC